MAIRNHLAKFLAFRTIPTTALTLCLFIGLFLAVTSTDEVPRIPSDHLGLNITQADLDLHAITARPHPFISHNNDKVRSYILSRLQTIASSHPDHVHLVDDTISNASWAAKASPHAVYFEGTNILVKIDGTDNDYVDKDAVLFSAHYDTVSMAAGTTDDGMGTVTLLQMVEYLANNRPKRTAVFNINNGEEDGLHGAHAFLEHSWSNITSVFLNLEGAAAGGRPILFRTTSLGPTRAFQNKYVAHPHGNVIGADGYSTGLLDAYTDYQIYATNGMEGLDFAFYKGRSKYHTKYDAIPTTEGGRKALWAMMGSVRGAGWALLNEGGPMKGGGKPVYFDVLGSSLVSVTLHAQFALDVALLVLGPIFLAVLGFFIYSKWQREQDATVQITSRWSKGWGSLLLTFFFGVVAQVGPVVGYVKVNPFTIHSSPLLVLTSTLSFAYLSIHLLLWLSAHLLHVTPARQRSAIILEMYLLSWVFLVVATVATHGWEIGATYWVTALNLGCLGTCTVGSMEVLFGTGSAGFGDGLATRKFARGIRYELPESLEPVAEENEELGDVGENDANDNGDRNGEHGHEGEVVDTVATEITPLMYQDRERSPDGEEYVTRRKQRTSEEMDGTIGWWIAQMLLLVFAPVLLLLQVALLVVSTLGGTMMEGSPPGIVYAATSAISFLIILPLAPFMHKIHRSITYLVLAAFIFTTSYAWLAFPFSEEAPFKVYFQQTVELDTSGPRVITSLTSDKWYLEKLVIPQLPSTWGTTVACGPRSDFWSCKWESGLLPAPGSVDGEDASHAMSEGSDVLNGSTRSLESRVHTSPAIREADWLRLNVTALNSSSALISIKGINTRACRLYFDNGRITYFHVRDSATAKQRSEMQAGYEIPDGGLVDLRLWSRNWEQEFVVEVGWQHEGGLEGRAACKWAEYESGTAGTGFPPSGARIPALEEALAFLPKWAVVTNANDGLVEAWKRFST